MTSKHLPSSGRASRTKTQLYRATLSAFWLFLVLLSPTMDCEGKYTEPPDTLLKAIQDQANRTKTVKCSFEQERHLSIFSRPIIFTGKMELSRPNKLRWENLDPIPSVLIFSGDKGIRCNDDAPPVNFELKKDPVMRMIAEQIWTWVDGGYARMRDKYDITLSDVNEILLVPRNGEFVDIIASIRVTFNQENLQPETIHILETEGDSTTIRFTGYRLNESVDQNVFTTCYPGP